MQSKAATVAAYLAELPSERRAVVEAVRQVILQNLDAGYAEGMQYGMIGYYVPHSLFPAGYHCDPRQPLGFACLGAQKNYFSLYLGCVYGNADLRQWFESAWAKTGKKLDMGKSCVRFKRLDDLALEVIAAAIRRVPAKKYIAHYEALLAAQQNRPTKGPPQRPARGKSAAKPRAVAQRAKSKPSPARGASKPRGRK